MADVAPQLTGGAAAKVGLGECARGVDGLGLHLLPGVFQVLVDRVEEPQL